MEKHRGIIFLRLILAIVLPGALIIGASPENFLEISVRVGGIALLLLAADVAWWVVSGFQLLSPKNLGYLQCLVDLIALSLGLHLYGGASGPSGFLFVLIVFEGGMLLDRRGAGLVMGACASAYVVLLLLEAQGLGNPLFRSALDAGLLPPRVNLLVQAAVKILLFGLVSEVSSRVTETLEAAHIDVRRNLDAAQAARSDAERAKDEAVRSKEDAIRAKVEAEKARDAADESGREAKFMAEFNRAIIENVPVGVLVLASDGQVLVYNAAMERITEVPPADALERHYNEIFPGLADQWAAILQKVQESGEEMHLLGVRVPTIRGREVTANVRILPLKTGDAVLGVVLAFQTPKR